MAELNLAVGQTPCRGLHDSKQAALEWKLSTSSFFAVVSKVRLSRDVKGASRGGGTVTLGKDNGGKRVVGIGNGETLHAREKGGGEDHRLDVTQMGTKVVGD